MTHLSSERPVARSRRFQRSALLAWGLSAAICFAALIEIGMGLVNPPPDPGGLWQARTVAWGMVPIVFAVPAALIIARDPRNRVGWILLVPAIAMATGTPIDTYLGSFTSAPPATLPVLLMTWFQNWSWLLLILPLPLIMLLFPTGSPPTRRWRWVQAYALVLLVLVVLLITFGDTLAPQNEAWSVPNPVGFIPNDTQTLALLNPVWIGGLGLLVIVSAAALFLRYRRAGLTERLQIKWLLYTAAIFVLFYLPMLASQGGSSWLVSGLPDLLLAVTIMLFPVAIAVAILRYRLWDIDVIINRTLVYVPLTAIIAGIFSAATSLLQKAFVALTGSESVASTVIATVVVVAAFNPVKDRVQKTVDRGFKETPDPTRRLKPFQELLRGRVWQVDVNHATKRFLEEAVAAFDAEGGAAYRVANGGLQPIHVMGQWHGEEKLVAAIDCGGGSIARIALGTRRRGRDYAEADRRTLQQVAAEVSRAIEEDDGCGAAGE